jgi:hypothetical protein
MEAIPALSSLSTTSSILLPIGAYIARGCWNSRMRHIRQIQKHTIVLPTKGGKTYLYTKLASQKKYMVIDVDSFIKTFCTEAELAILEMATDAKNLLEEDLYYSECANRMLAYVRSQLKKNKSMKVLFLTSSWAWAKQFKYDSVTVCCPDKDFFNSDILKRFPEEAETIRQKRDHFLATVPEVKGVHRYNSYEELEKQIRATLDIIHEL